MGDLPSFAQDEFLEVQKERKQLRLLAIVIAGVIVPVSFETTFFTYDDVTALVFFGLSFVYALLGLHYVHSSRRYDQVVRHLEKNGFGEYLNTESPIVVPTWRSSSLGVARAQSDFAPVRFFYTILKVLKFLYRREYVWTALNFLTFLFRSVLFLMIGFTLAVNGELYTLGIGVVVLVADLFAFDATIHKWSRGWKAQQILRTLPRAKVPIRSSVAVFVVLGVIGLLIIRFAGSPPCPGVTPNGFSKRPATSFAVRVTWSEARA